MDYYLAGYYLIKLRQLDFRSFSSKFIYCCSTCINDSLLDSFSRSWTFNSDYLQQVKDYLKIDLTKINQIQEWVEKKDLEGRTGYLNIFYDIAAAKEYRDRFFSNLENIKIFALYFPCSESEDIIKEFELQNSSQVEFGIVHILKNKKKAIGDANIIGYDLIGIELDGNFHSFHCHDLYSDLNRQFGVQLNKYGLLDSDLNWEKLINYMNDEKNGCEPVPWYFAQIRLIE